MEARKMEERKVKVYLKRGVLFLVAMLAFAMLSLYGGLGLSKVEASQAKYGDLNQDGEISVQDLVLLKRYIVGSTSQIDTKLADVTLDNQIDVSDVIRMSEYIAGYDVALGDQKRETDPYFSHGKLKVSDGKIVDKYGKEVQLKGLGAYNFFWDNGADNLAYFSNKESLQSLRDDWGVNIVKVPAFVGNYGGYCCDDANSPSTDALDNDIDLIVKNCHDLGLYVVIDWKADGVDPSKYQDAALDFFSRMSSKYASYGNVLYEVAESPSGVSWDGIKDYANACISEIRANVDDAIIIVDAPSYGSDASAITSKLSYENTVYGLHMNMSGQGTDGLSSLIGKGYAVILTNTYVYDPWNYSKAADYNKAAQVRSYIDNNKVSFISTTFSKNDNNGMNMIANTGRETKYEASKFTAHGLFMMSMIKGIEFDASQAGSSSSGSSSSVDTSPVEAIDPPAETPLAKHGKLHVEGTNIVDEHGNPFQLRGVSTHGLGWNDYGNFLNKDAFVTLRDDWHCNVYRVAMYICEGDKSFLNAPETNYAWVDDAVRYGQETGMYVVIDWHFIARNPNEFKDQARDFFDTVSKKYKDLPNVLFELCNEPTVDYANEIKPYAEDMISTIRGNGADQIIICGTNTWSQDVDAVIGNKIDDANTVYTLHFYAGTHGDGNRQKYQRAIDNGVPVLVSECSITDASGNGNLAYDSGNTWFDLLDDNNTGYIVWSLCDKDESSALISGSVYSDWNPNTDLTGTGTYFRNRFITRAKALGE